MKLLSTITFLFIFSLTIQAQTIQVLDEETKKPVTGVAVFNDSKLITGITDINGNIDITNFLENEKIVFLVVIEIFIFIYISKKAIYSKSKSEV